MKIAIVCAMEEELDSILSELQLKCAIINDKCFNVHCAEYNDHQLVFILSGIGKVNAAIHTQYIIDKFAVDLVINVGVAGSLSKDLVFGDVVIASDLVQHDVDVQAFGLNIGQIPRMDVFSFISDTLLLDYANKIVADGFNITTGRIISGDKFIDDKAMAKYLADTFNAVACEMEGAAIAHVCHINKVRFIVIRALSDMAGNDDKAAIHSFNELKEMAANRSSYVVNQILQQCI